MRVAELAVEVAKVSAPVNTDPVVLAPEPSHGDVTWISAYEVDPFDGARRREGRPAHRLERAAAGRTTGSTTPTPTLAQVLENKFYADTAGTTTTQQRVRLHPQLTAVAVDRPAGGFETMRTLAPPVGRGWEYLTGTGWDFPAEIADAARPCSRRRSRRRASSAGDYDLVIDPSNLWLTIHESIGHATELDRALGYEAAYAGHLLRHPGPARHPALRLAR